MAGRFLDLIGTLYSKLQLGIGGPFLKNDSGAVAARNTADNAYADIHAALVKVFGEQIVLNAGAAGAGDDWTYTLQRPGSGQERNMVVVLPPGGPAPGQALTVATFDEEDGIVTLEWTSIAAGTDKLIVDTTTIAFGSTSPVSMFTRPANAIVEKIQVIIDTPFDGSPNLSIGVSGNTSKYMGSTQVALTAAAGTVFEVTPGVAAVGSTEAMIATYSAGSASVGSARVLVSYVIPG